MKVEEIFNFLNEISPFSLQESWDNSGLQVGSLQSEIEMIVLALEIDDAVLENLMPKSLVIVHHPLIFKGLKQIDFTQYPSMYLRKLIEKQCSVIAMHTNFDLSHLNCFIAREILGFKNAYQEGLMMFSTLKTCHLETLALRVKNKLGLKTIRVCKASDRIDKVAIVCGSGFSLFHQISNYQNLCFLTGDIKYHDAMQAKAMGISLIDILHYESECNFVEILSRILQKKGYKAIISKTKPPFIFL